MRLISFAGFTLGAAVLAGCGGGGKPAPATGGATTGGGAPLPAADVGLSAPYRATVVADKLMNPSGLAIGPQGQLTICDSGNGRVLVVKDGQVSDYITGFDTEYWKVDAVKHINRFKLGPLSAVWLGETLAVTDGGKKDGAETVLFFDQGGAASSGAATNSVPPTTKDPKDQGEGNLTGMAVAADNDTIWVCGQGADSKTWVLKAQKSTMKLEPAFSADDNGIAVNSPMQALVWDATKLLVLYSGKGGAEDGLIVEWNVQSGKPQKQWTLPGLVDPMGMARIPGSDELVVVDNNWALTQVNEGKIARVTLPAAGGAATVTVIGSKLRGAVACVFGPGKALYVAQLGAEFDKNLGQVLRITGF